jgi:hypothetical protein
MHCRSLFAQIQQALATCGGGRFVDGGQKMGMETRMAAGRGGDRCVGAERSAR